MELGLGSRQRVLQLAVVHIFGGITPELGFGFVANDLDVVPVWANDESRIVLSRVVWAKPGRTIVFAASLQCRVIKGLDLLATLGYKRQMEMP